MIIILPTRHKQQLRLIYMLRFAIASLLVFASVFSVASALFLPHFLFFRSVHHSLEQTHSALSATFKRQKYHRELAVAHDTTKMMQTLTRLEDPVIVDEIFDFLNILRKVTGVQVTRIRYRTENDTIRFSFSGLAQTRAPIVQLQKMLQHTNRYNKVSVPLSALAGEKNFPFTINLIRTRAYEK